jgi:fermentation-respiration switch protein FrsA (DUF1100 family)
MKRVAAAGLVAVAVWVGTSQVAGAAARPAVRPARFAVGTTILRFDDQGRSVVATVYYPATGRATPLEVDDAPRNTKWAPYPLILFSHDYGATPNDYKALLHSWAERGYVVAVPTYPVPADQPTTTTTGATSTTALTPATGVTSTTGPTSTTDATSAETATVDIGERVIDASFVIDRMLDRVQGGFGTIVDPHRIVAAGHAIGAVTTFVLAYNTGARDPRIDAAMTLAGGLVGDGSNYFTGVDTPLLAIHGDADATDPIAGTQDAFDLANPPKFYVTLLGSDHSTSFVHSTDPGFDVVEKTTLDFLSAYIGHRPSGLQQLERDGTVKSLSKLTSQPS